MPRKNKFPKEIYVGICNEGTDDEFLEAKENPTDLVEKGDPGEVTAAVYVYSHQERIINETRTVEIKGSRAKK